MRRSYILGILVIVAYAQPSVETTLEPVGQSKVMGEVAFIGYADHIVVLGTLVGLTPGAHGFHIHQIGDCGGQGALAAGGHFNPTNQSHGKPSVDSHRGDLGNIYADDKGVAVIDKTFMTLT